MKKLYHFLIIISLSVTMTSCANKTEKLEIPSKPVIQSPLKFKEKEQEFKIINYYQENLDFLDKARKEPNNLEVLYKETVIEELRNNGFSYDELSEWMFSTPTNLEALEESMDRLIDKQILLNESIKEALSDSASKLPGGDKTVHILPARPEFFLHDKHVFGLVWNENSMLILINPSFLEEDLKYSVAHEYHHTVFMETAVYTPYNLLEDIIVEGKATMFAEIIYPDVENPWNKSFSSKDENTWKIFMDNLESSNSEVLDDFQNGNQWTGIPMWSNYTIGYQVMEKFLEHNPNLTIEEWTQMGSKDILEKSKVKDD